MGSKNEKSHRKNKGTQCNVLEIHGGGFFIKAVLMELVGLPFTGWAGMGEEVRIIQV